MNREHDIVDKTRVGYKPGHFMLPATPRLPVPFGTPTRDPHSNSRLYSPSTLVPFNLGAGIVRPSPIKLMSPSSKRARMAPSRNSNLALLMNQNNQTRTSLVAKQKHPIKKRKLTSAAPARYQTVTAPEPTNEKVVWHDGTPYCLGDNGTVRPIIGARSEDCFSLVQQPNTTQRKAYRKENRSIQPAPLIIRYNGKNEIVRGFALVNLLRQSPTSPTLTVASNFVFSVDPSKVMKAMMEGKTLSITKQTPEPVKRKRGRPKKTDNIIQSDNDGKVLLGDTIKLLEGNETNFMVKICQTSRADLFLLEFNIVYWEAGKKNPIQEIVVSSPFSVASHQVAGQAALRRKPTSRKKVPSNKKNPSVKTSESKKKIPRLVPLKYDSSKPTTLAPVPSPPHAKTLPLPELVRINPQSGCAGDEVWILGRNFVPQHLAVTIGGIRAKVICAYDNMVSFIVPEVKSKKNIKQVVTVLHILQYSNDFRLQESTNSLEFQYCIEHIE